MVLVKLITALIIPYTPTVITNAADQAAMTFQLW